jgi:hypothetical protein
VNDGCNNLIQCGNCTLPDICGGAGLPSVCGSVGIDAGTCTGLCQNQQACPGVPNNTSLTGVVYAPTQADAGYGNPDPIPGALIYVPNAPVASLDGDGGVTCDQCADGVSGSPLVSTYSATNGSFTLTNVPCGVNVPVVIQLGKWRRYVTVPSPACCVNTALTPEQTRLPRKQGEFHPADNIPRIAVVTGSADSIECVLPKIGVATDQYSLPSGNGRVKFYRDNGAQFSGTAPAASTLYNSLAEMKKYDMIILDCVGGEQQKTFVQRQNLEAYANQGGRVFTSHYAYVWLYNLPSSNSFTPSANWTPNGANPSSQDARIDISFPKGVTFADWVQLVNAQAATSTPTIPRIRIINVRNDLSAVNNPPGQTWVYGKASGSNVDQTPFQFTFNTPTTAMATNQCGRVLFSDFHVSNISGSGTFPGQCGAAAPMTPQEKVFEYLIFDLSSCIKPDVPPPQSCTPRTCAQQNLACGPAGDGCGGTLNCGTCTAPQTCGGAGVIGQCGVPCVPRTCAQIGANCGTQGNGCGGTITCGTCTAPQTCGGGGTPNVCGGGQCVPTTCAALGFTCGQQGDGCGGTLNCGTCTMPQTCGGGGVPGRCGGATCNAATCASLGVSCGQWGDGCGNTLNCGNCTSPQTCGGGGVAGQCGGGMCTPKTCAQQNFNCGTQGDTCGGTISCGTCTLPQTCGGGGVPGVCGGGGTCQPRTCLMQGFNCGLQGDGCGTQIDCGPCPPGQICGAQGPGLCGAAQCTPLSCSAQGIQCGPAGDGCGNIIQCGSCPAGQSCGGAGVPGVCGNRPCTPRTCDQIPAPNQGDQRCGLAADGCGGTINCGPCPPDSSCGGGGTPNVCGTIG